MLEKVAAIICILFAVGGAFYGGRILERAKRKAELAKSLVRIQKRKHYDGRS